MTSGVFPRLHREALKQSATDPKTGLIDVNILATGLSVSDRHRRVEIAKALKTMLQSKGRAPNMDAQRLFEDFRDESDVVRSALLCFPLALLCKFPFPKHRASLNVTSYTIAFLFCSL